MTIADIPSYVFRNGNGATTSFPFSFFAGSSDHIKVTRLEADGTTTEVSPASYTVNLIGSIGGEVIFTTPPESGVTLYIYRETPTNQEVDVSKQTGYDPTVVAGVWDKLTAIAQELRATVSRAVLAIPGVDPSETLSEIFQARADAVVAAQATADDRIQTGQDRQASEDAADRAELYGPLTFTRAAAFLSSEAVTEDMIGKRAGTQDGLAWDIVEPGAGDFDHPASPAIGVKVVPFQQWMDAEAFGAKADFNGSTGTDDTAALERAIKAARKAHKRLLLTGKQYLVTDTLAIEDDPSMSTAFAIQGWNANQCRIYFDTDEEDKDLFWHDDDANYVTYEDFEVLSLNPGSGRALYFKDLIIGGTSDPAWKFLFKNMRVSNFNEMVRYDGGATFAQDAHLSEVMWLHSKGRNNRTGMVFNNAQAVNHQLIGMDFENSGEGAEAWPHIVMERGSTINHLGGSVIGKGSYLKYRYHETAGFQNTSQFVSKGVRVEKRGAYSTPVIDHDPTSVITFSNSLRVIVDDMPVVFSGDTGTPVFARVGGRSFMKFSNVHANMTATVDAYMTTNLTGNSEYGFIDMGDNCLALQYKRVSDVAAYGSAGVASTNYRAIPAEISRRGDGTPGQTVSGYYNPLNVKRTIYSGGWQQSSPKTLVYAPADNSGFGSGNADFSSLLQIPLYARPYKFRLLRDDVTAGSAFVLTLYAEVGGTDYKVAEITPTADTGGHFEANLQTATGLTYWIRDDVNWDGKMRIKKTGTTNGYIGLIMIDYM